MAVSTKPQMPTESEIAEWAVRRLAATLHLVRYNALPAIWSLQPGLRKLREQEAPPNGEHVLGGESPAAPTEALQQAPPKRRHAARGKSPAAAQLSLQGADAFDTQPPKR